MKWFHHRELYIQWCLIDYALAPARDQSHHRGAQTNPRAAMQAIGHLEEFRNAFPEPAWPKFVISCRSITWKT